MFSRPKQAGHPKYKTQRDFVTGKTQERNSSAKSVKILPEKIESHSGKSLDDLKRQLSAWAENERIPGKIQAWFAKDVLPENCDWKIVGKMVSGHEALIIDAPAKGMEPPKVVKSVFEQLKKEHLRIFKKALRQIWFRSTGDRRFALIVQANCHGRDSARGYKTLVDFVQRNLPEIISCHIIQCQPEQLFNPASKPSGRIDCKCSFGNDFMPIAQTGFYMHVLDWAPKMKDTWISLPTRIKDAIHPTAEDKFFEFYAASSYVGASLASCFKQVDSMDCRETAMQSSRYNARSLADENLHFHRGSLSVSTLTKFFSKSENEGRWTFYINLPEGEGIPSGCGQAIAAARPERILLQQSDLEQAAKEIRHFRREGYVLRKTIPLCLEPGTGKFELLMLFVPDRAGLLGQNNLPKNKNGQVKRPREQVSHSKTANKGLFATEIPTFRQRKG